MIQIRQVLFFAQTEIFQQKYGKKMTILSKSSIVIESGIILTEKMRRKIRQEEERMRGVETRIQEIRHAIFTEVAKMAYDVDSPVEKTIEEIPYRVIPGEVGNFRNDVFLERAIVGERLRLAMGLPCRISNWQTRRRRIIHRRSLMSSNLHATPVMKNGF